MLSYSLSFPFDSLKRLYITEASTLAGENVFGSLSKEMTLRRMVLRMFLFKKYIILFINKVLQNIYRTFCVGFHLSQGNSPLCGSSIGGCKIEMHRSPFYKKQVLLKQVFNKTNTYQLTSYTFGCQTLVRNFSDGGLYG